jgi:hypothetical protein
MRKALARKPTILLTFRELLQFLDQLPFLPNPNNLRAIFSYLQAFSMAFTVFPLAFVATTAFPRKLALSTTDSVAKFTSVFAPVFITERTKTV